MFIVELLGWLIQTHSYSLLNTWRVMRMRTSMTLLGEVLTDLEEEHTMSNPVMTEVGTGTLVV